MAAINLGLASDRAAYGTTPRFTRLRPFRLRHRRKGPVGAVARTVGAVVALALYAFAIAFGPVERLLVRDDRRRQRASTWTAEPGAPAPFLANPMRVAPA